MSFRTNEFVPMVEFHLPLSLTPEWSVPSSHSVVANGNQMALFLLPQSIKFNSNCMLYRLTKLWFTLTVLQA